MNQSNFTNNQTVLTDSDLESRPQGKIDHFVFKNSNIIIEGIIQKRKDYFSRRKFERQKIILLINFTFPRIFFHVASCQIFYIDAILINHGSFF